MSFEESLPLVDFTDYPIPSPSSSFYFAPYGNDTSGNGSSQNPFKTVGRSYQALNEYRNSISDLNAYGYIIAKPGVYSSDTLGRPEFISGTVARGTGIFNLDGMMNVTVMSELPLKAKVDSFSGFEQIGTHGTGTEYETVVLQSLPGLTYTVQSGPSSFLIHYFYGLSANPANVSPTFALTTAESNELPRFVEDRLPYPAIYGYAPSEDIANWRSYPELWTMSRTDANRYNLGLTYDIELDSQGITHYYIRAREDLIAAAENNLQNPFGGNFDFANTFWSKIEEINSRYPSMDWSTCSIFYRGGNSNIQETYVRGIDVPNKRIEVLELPSWYSTNSVFSINGIKLSGNGQPTSSIGIVNKFFADKPYMYCYERDTGYLYYKTPADNPNLPRAGSGSLGRSGFHLKGCTNVTVAGFHFCGYDSCFLIVSPYANASSINSNFYFKYNACCDSNASAAGIQMGSVAGEFEVVGNVIIRASRRAINYSRRPFKRDVNGTPLYDITRDQLTTAKIHKNICYDWRDGAGLYSSGDKAIFSENTLLVAAAAHGDGIALYDQSRDIVVKDNYIYTPGIIGIAINDIDPLSEPLLIEGNYIQSIVNRASGESVGLTIKNNVIRSYSQSELLVNLADAVHGLWWDAQPKTTFRNNVILKLGQALDYEGARNADGTHIVYTNGLPPQFSQVAQNLGSTLSRAYQYWSHKWLASDSLPNAYNNVTPARYSFDDEESPYGNDISYYPYTETSTINVNKILNPESNFQIPRYAISQSEQQTIDSIYDSMFVDWRQGDFRLVEQFNSDPSNPVGTSITTAHFDYASQTGITNLDARVHEWWKPSETQTNTGTSTGDPPPPIANHPITIRLTTTDIDSTLTWNNKKEGLTHSTDSFFPSNEIFQIPNYLERIDDVADPNDSSSIGPSRSNEIQGNNPNLGGQGGVYVTGGILDVTINPSIGVNNKVNVKDIAVMFHTKARKQGGLTLSLILHGKSNPDSTHGEFKYISPPAFDPDNPDQTDFDVLGEFYPNFYKKFAYISFHSKEATVIQSITSNQFSFRKSPHHTYINFSRPEMDGLSLSSASNGTSIIDMVTPFVSTQKLAKLQTATIGCTCNFNSYGIESTSATKVTGISTATTITCKNINLEYLGFDGNQVRFKNKTASSMFSSRTSAYQHDGAIGSANQTFQFDSSINDYRFDIPLSEPDNPIPEQSINFRFINPIGSGSKNLLGYKVPAAGVRLFGGSSNIGITAGSYIRISGSPNNNGIYQVLSTIDGIDGDNLSNTFTNGSTEYQYLELSRSITAQEQSVGNEIKLENISHLPLMHIKYKQPLL